MTRLCKSTPIPHQKQTKNHADLIAELAQLHRREGEIIAQLQGQSVPKSSKPKTKQRRGRPVPIPPNYDPLRYAKGIIWDSVKKNMSISASELAEEVGVAISTLYQARWAEVLSFCKRDLSEKKKFAKKADEYGYEDNEF